MAATEPANTDSVGEPGVQSTDRTENLQTAQVPVQMAHLTTSEDLARVFERETRQAAKHFRSVTVADIACQPTPERSKIAGE
jgi:hypothetical protein